MDVVGVFDEVQGVVDVESGVHGDDLVLGFGFFGLVVVIIVILIRIIIPMIISIPIRRTSIIMQLAIYGL